MKQALVRVYNDADNCYEIECKYIVDFMVKIPFLFELSVKSNISYSRRFDDTQHQDTHRNDIQRNDTQHDNKNVTLSITGFDEE